MKFQALVLRHCSLIFLVCVCGAAGAQSEEAKPDGPAAVDGLELKNAREQVRLLGEQIEDARKRMDAQWKQIEAMQKALDLRLENMEAAPRTAMPAISSDAGRNESGEPDGLGRLIRLVSAFVVLGSVLALARIFASRWWAEDEFDDSSPSPPPSREKRSASARRDPEETAEPVVVADPYDDEDEDWNPDIPDEPTRQIVDRPPAPRKKKKKVAVKRPVRRGKVARKPSTAAGDDGPVVHKIKPRREPIGLEEDSETLPISDAESTDEDETL